MFRVQANIRDSSTNELNKKLGIKEPVKQTSRGEKAWFLYQEEEEESTEKLDRAGISQWQEEGELDKLDELFSVKGQVPHVATSPSYKTWNKQGLRGKMRTIGMLGNTMVGYEKHKERRKAHKQKGSIDEVVMSSLTSINATTRHYDY